MIYLPAILFAKATKLSERAARHAIGLCAAGKPWRGHHLPVVQLPGQRGGASGITWGLDLSRATPELLDDFPGLKSYLETPPVPAKQGNGADIEPWRVKVQSERFEIIKPAIDTRPRTGYRAEALAKIAAQTVTYRGSRQRLHVKTIRDWLIAYDSNGLAGLLPEPNGQPGKRRVLVSRAWDADIDLPEDRKAMVADVLGRYALSLIAKSMSGRKVQRLAGKRLVELCQSAGSEVNRAELEKLCKINAKFTDRFRDGRRVARHDLDNKAFFDKDLPRIARGRCARPMKLVWGDAHPIDIYMKSVDGKGQLRLRLIAWMDDHSRFMWATVAVFGKGRGVRQTDVADAIFNMVCDPAAGVPRVLYLDNGGEYSAIGQAMMEIPGAVDALAACGGAVKAQPYNGPAKGVIENAFSILEQGYFKHLPGWIGGDRTDKKTHAVGKPVKGFEGSVEDLIKAVLDMVAAYNDAPQGGQLGGLSPRQAMQEAVNKGWQAVAMDEDAFDFAFSRREDRVINQGRFRFDNEFWVSDGTLQLGAGDPVSLRIPLRSGSDGVFVLHEGKRLQGRAVPDTRYHPLDRAGAREKSRRVRLQADAIRRIKAQTDPAIDPAAELLKGMERASVAAAHGAIIRLGDEDPERAARDEDEARRAELEDLVRHFNGDQERRAGGE